MSSILWERISQLTPPAERFAVRVSIGPSLIETNEKLTVELEALESISDDFRMTNDQIVGGRLRRKALPDAPERKLLEERVKGLLGVLKSKNDSGGQLSPERFGKDRGTFEYFEGKNNDEDKPPRPSMSATTASSVSVPKSSSPASFNPSSTRSCPDVLESLTITAFSSHSVINELREAFLEEQKELLANIDMVNAILEHENERGLAAKKVSGGAGANKGKPGIDDLRRFEGRLEEELRQKEMFVDVGRKSGHASGGKSGGMGAIKKLDMSPLKGRAMVESSKNNTFNNSANVLGSATGSASGSSKASKMRAKMEAARSTGRFEETLDDDDLKFFS
jgi:hypothetical protein